MRCLLNYKPTKGRLRFPCHSMLLSCVCCLLLLCCLVIVAKVIKIVTFHATFAFFLPPQDRISVVFWCERGIKLEPVVYSGAMAIAANQGHLQHKLGSGGAFSEGIMYSKWPKCSIAYTPLGDLSIEPILVHLFHSSSHNAMFTTTEVAWMMLLMFMNAYTSW